MMILFNVLLLFVLCSFQILGNAGLCLQQEFYNVEGLAQELASSVFVNLDHVPDYRLRLMIHILCLLGRVSWFMLQSVDAPIIALLTFDDAAVDDSSWMTDSRSV